MDRRRFLTSSLATSALVSGSAEKVLTGAPADGKTRDYYELRRYHLSQGANGKVLDQYLGEVLIPALNKLGITPIGAFNLDIGVETPSRYLLIPSTSADTLLTSQFRLEQDAGYLNAASSFLNVPAKEPVYSRIESSLMIAFEGHPKLTVPPVTASHGQRTFELRTYESPTDQDHRRKIEMFHSGEFGIFQRAGFWEVFYGDTLIGPRQPQLTYMIGFPDLNERASKWKAFFSDPQWKKLSSSQRFSFEGLVSNVTNLILSPTSYSQI